MTGFNRRHRRKDDANGNHHAQPPDSHSRDGIRRALSHGLLRRAGRTLPPLLLTDRARIEVEDERFLGIYLVAMAVLAWLTVLTGAYIIYPWYRAVAAAGDREPRCISAAPADVEPLHHRLALHRHGVEGARGLARAHLHHHGRGGLYRATGATCRISPSFAPRFWVLCGSRCSPRALPVFWRHAQQERAGRGRLNDPHRRRENTNERSNSSDALQARDFPNGAGAAAVLAAGIGSFLVAVFAILADQSAAIKSLMNFYKPTGPLSGVTTCAIVVWLAAWFILHRRWSWRNVDMARVARLRSFCSFSGLLLTFPPIADCFEPRAERPANSKKRRSRFDCRLRRAWFLPLLYYCEAAMVMSVKVSPST